WQMEIAPGMAMMLTLNQDGTCAMDMMGEIDPGVWRVVDGKADVMGIICEIDGSGQLVCAEQGMVFVKAGGGEAAESISYVDVTFVLTRAETVYNGQKIPLDASSFGEYKVRFNSDGSAELTQSGLALESQHLTWSVTDAGAYLIDYSVGGVFIMDYTFLPVAEGVTMDFYGTLMTFTPAE
ncbi:MAG: hypothetical protein IKK75_12510, partial [Clostridia bacterium]|nr:hypothetical protein [Clostridia bacterium]